MDSSFLTLYSCDEDELILFVTGEIKDKIAYARYAIANKSEILFEEVKALEGALSVNQAEYVALISILSKVHAEFNSVKKIQIYLGKVLIVKQLKNMCKTTDYTLLRLKSTAQSMMSHFERLKIQAIPGELIKGMFE